MRQIFIRLAKNSFIRNSFVLFAGTMIVNVLNYVFHLVVGRMVEPAAYGEIESLISLLAIISVPAATLTLIATKYAANMKAGQDTRGVRILSRYLNRKLFFYGLPLLVLAFCLTPLVKRFLNIGSNLPILYLWGVMALSFLSAVTAGILTGWQKFFHTNISGVLSTILKLGAAFLFIRWGFGVSGVIGSYALAILFGYLISLFFLRRFFYQDASPEDKSVEPHFPSLKGYVLPAFYGTLAVAILGNADMIFAKHHLGAEASGEYGALFIVAKTIFFVTGVLTTVLFAMSAEESASEKRATYTFRIAAGLTCLTALVSVFFFSLFPGLVMGVFFGEKYLAVSHLLGWFALAAGTYSIANLFLQYLLSLHKTRIASLFLALSGLEIAALFFFGEGLYAIIGITIGTQMLAALLGLFFVLKENHHAKADFYRHPSL